MRTVFTSAPDEVFEPGRDRLVAAFVEWAAADGRDVDEFAVDVVLEHRWSLGDGLLARWTPEHFERVLIDWYPGKVTTTPEESAAAIPTLHAYVDFLVAEDLLDAHSAPPADLHAALDGLAPRFGVEMADRTRYGMAKFWAMTMIDAGLDPTDDEASQGFVADVQAGRITYDHDVLDQIMTRRMIEPAAHLEPMPQRHLVDLPDRDAARIGAEASTVLRQLRDLVAWVGDGRALTATGRLRVADARELVTLLATDDVVDPVIGTRARKTTTSADLRGVSLIHDWAVAARFVRHVKGRLVPVKSRAGLLTDPLALAARALTALDDLGDQICHTQFFTTSIAASVGQTIDLITLVLLTVDEPLPAAELISSVVDLVGGDDPRATPWSLMLGAVPMENDVHAIVEILADLGVCTHTPDQIDLTPLGRVLAYDEHLAAGAVITIDDLLDETAEVVVVTALSAPPTVGHRLLSRWRAHRPAAPGELLALAERVDDPEIHDLATTWAAAEPPAPPAPPAPTWQTAGR